jgi:hypothetical protein
LHSDGLHNRRKGHKDGKCRHKITILCGENSNLNAPKKAIAESEDWEDIWFGKCKEKQPDLLLMTVTWYSSSIYFRR